MSYDPAFPIGFLMLLFGAAVVIGLPILWISWMVSFANRKHSIQQKHLFLVWTSFTCCVTILINRILYSHMIHACYKYIGKDTTSLKQGEKYNLLVYEFNLFERLFGNYPFRWKIMGYRPFDPHTPLYPYGSKAEFNKDWKRIPQKPKKHP